MSACSLRPLVLSQIVGSWRLAAADRSGPLHCRGPREKKVPTLDAKRS